MQKEEYRYKLEKYQNGKSRHICPSCGKKEFTRYIDTETGNYISEEVGRCERLNNCAYHYTPKQYFEQHGKPQPETWQHDASRKHTKSQPQPKQAVFTTIDKETVKSSLSNYDANNFVQFLLTKFGHDATKQAIQNYFIGTSKHWSGATVFWQLDKTGKARAGKVFLYNASTGKRVKDKLTWVHSILKLQNFELNQCLFGEHLLSQPANNGKPIAIVESEKTAIIASLYLPHYVWLATGGIHNLKPEKLTSLAGKKIYLFPDLKTGYAIWEKKAAELKEKRYNVIVSYFLQEKAGEEAIKAGYDIADYLLHFDLHEFKKALHPAQPEQSIFEQYGIYDTRLKDAINFITSNPMPYPLHIDNGYFLNTPEEVIDFFQVWVQKAIAHQPEPDNIFLTTLETIQKWVVSNYFAPNGISVKK